MLTLKAYVGCIYWHVFSPVHSSMVRSFDSPEHLAFHTHTAVQLQLQGAKTCTMWKKRHFAKILLKAVQIPSQIVGDDSISKYNSGLLSLLSIFFVNIILEWWLLHARCWSKNRQYHDHTTCRDLNIGVTLFPLVQMVGRAWRWRNCSRWNAWSCTSMFPGTWLAQSLALFQCTHIKRSTCF